MVKQVVQIVLPAFLYGNIIKNASHLRRQLALQLFTKLFTIMKTENAVHLHRQTALLIHLVCIN